MTITACVEGTDVTGRAVSTAAGPAALNFAVAAAAVTVYLVTIIAVFLAVSEAVSAEFLEDTNVRMVAVTLEAFPSSFKSAIMATAVSIYLVAVIARVGTKVSAITADLVALGRVFIIMITEVTKLNLAVMAASTII